jgi:hypothetical protein
MRRFMLGAVAAMVAGVSANASTPKDVGMRGKASIEYVSHGCATVACPTYKIQLWKDGQGVFTGVANTVIAGEAKFSVSEQQYSAFEGMLEDFRPARDTVYDARTGGPCKQVAPDQASVEVTWRSGGVTRKLHYNYGCDREKHVALAAALQNAPKLLPTRQMIARGW